MFWFVIGCYKCEHTFVSQCDLLSVFGSYWIGSVHFSLHAIATWWISFHLFVLSALAYWFRCIEEAKTNANINRIKIRIKQLIPWYGWLRIELTHTEISIGHSLEIFYLSQMIWHTLQMCMYACVRTSFILSRSCECMNEVEWKKNDFFLSTDSIESSRLRFICFCCCWLL